MIGRRAIQRRTRVAPHWAWRGALTLQDARSLFGDGPELAEGVATAEFSAPAELVHLSDYGDWNDHLGARLDDPRAGWEPLPCTATADTPLQACVPHLGADWVRDVRPLPGAGWPDALDLALPA